MKDRFSDHPAAKRYRAMFDPPKPPPPVCDICGALMIERACKLICPACGRRHDCSDGTY